MSPKPEEESISSPTTTVTPDLSPAENAEELLLEENNGGGEGEEGECLLTKAEQLNEIEKLNEAAKILRSLNQDVLQEKHHTILRYVNLLDVGRETYHLDFLARTAV